MNNTKYTIFIFISTCIFITGVYGMYKLHVYVSDYSKRVVETNTKLQALEEKRSIDELYKKILIKGSKEQAQIDSYILSGDSVFKYITDLENDTKNIGLFDEDGSGISSVRKRENGDLNPLGAGEVVLDIVASGSYKKVDSYIEALSNLPYVSYVESVSLSFDAKGKTRANIVLVITEIL